MSVDPNPWAVEGATISEGMARMEAYIASGGREGIVGPTDLAVTATPTPGPQVRVAPGAVAINSRGTNVRYEQYHGRVLTATNVDIAGTGSSAGRSDLVIARVEDPNSPGETWPVPPDPAAGPYFYLRVIPNVGQYVTTGPTSVVSVDQLGLGYTAYALGRVDLPPSTATVTQGMIADVRGMTAPRSGRETYSSTIVVPAMQQLTPANTAFTTFPSNATWTIPVPSWATHAKLTFSATGGYSTTGAGFSGFVRIEVDTLIGPGLPIVGIGAAAVRGSVGPFVTEFDIPAAMRGITHTARLSAAAYLASGNLILDQNSTITLRIDWFEAPHNP